MLISDLVSGEFLSLDRAQAASGTAPVRAEAIHGLLFKLLSEVTTTLKSSRAVACSQERDDVLPLVGRTKEIIAALWSHRRLDCRHLFHEDGKPLGLLRSEWNRACKKAGFRAPADHCTSCARWPTSS